LTPISALSTEYRRARVRATASDLSAIDLSGSTVAVAFASAADSAPSSWLSAAWDGTVVVGGLTWYVARFLVGPTGGVATLTPGTWQVWLKVTSSPEVAIFRVGSLVVTE
jgi:hypothetical protein